MTTEVGRDPLGQALVSDQAATHLDPTGFDPSRLLDPAVDAGLVSFLHPIRGIKRGVIEHAPGTQNGDRDSKVFPTTVGELRKLHALLLAVSAERRAIATEVRAKQVQS